MPRLILRYVVLPVAVEVEVWTTVFQMIDVLLVTKEQFSTDGKLTVTTELLTVIFLVVRLRLWLFNMRLSVLLASSWSLEVDEVRVVGWVVKVVELRVSLRPEVVAS